MAHYSIALGGNKRNWPEWDNLYASGNTAGNIDYAAHLKNRHKGLPFYFNGYGEDWRNYFAQELPTGLPVVGDSFDTHWINEGTDVKAIFVHVKRAADAGTTMLVGVRDGAGATVGSDVSVDLATPGFVKIPVDALMQTNGRVQIIAEAGKLETSCFAILIDLFNAFDEHPCSCEMVECDVPTPSPQCFTPTSGC